MMLGGSVRAGVVCLFKHSGSRTLGMDHVNGRRICGRKRVL